MNVRLQPHDSLLNRGSITTLRENPHVGHSWAKCCLSIIIIKSPLIIAPRPLLQWNQPFLRLQIAREELCGSNSAVTSGQLRRASRGGFVPSKLSWIHDVYRPVFRVQGHRVLRRVACPRTSDDVSAFSGRPHGELRVSPLPIWPRMTRQCIQSWLRAAWFN